MPLHDAFRQFVPIDESRNPFKEFKLDNELEGTIEAGDYNKFYLSMRLTQEQMITFLATIKTIKN